MNRTHYNYCIDNTIVQSNYGYANGLASQIERKEAFSA